MIADARAVVTVLLADTFGRSYPVYGWLPADTAELPAIVVGRPTLNPDDSLATAVAYTFPILVIGRRIVDDDSQAELDRTTDEVLAALKAFVGGLVLGPLHRATVSSVEPDVVSIAGDEYPAYRVVVSATSVLCT